MSFDANNYAQPERLDWNQSNVITLNQVQISVNEWNSARILTVVCFYIKRLGKNQSNEFSLKWVQIKMMESDYNPISEIEWNSSRITDEGVFYYKIARKEPKQWIFIEMSSNQLICYR